MRKESDDVGRVRTLYGAWNAGKRNGSFEKCGNSGGENGNGFTFKTYNAHDMLGAIRRAEGLFGNKALWNEAMTDAMESDFSWKKSANDYVNVYRMILND